MTGIPFSDLTDEDKRRLLHAYDSGGIAALRQRGYEDTADSIRRQLQRWHRGGRSKAALQTAPQAVSDNLTDFPAWLQGRRDKRRYISTMHLSDIHFPYHNPDALSLAYNLVDHVQPDLIVVGSDVFDFELLSSFGIDPDSADDVDELDRVQKYWLPHIHALNDAAPNARLVFIFGNHETRLIRYVINNAPQLRKTIWRRFTEIIRCDGRVDWLGETDRVMVGDTLIQHGNRTGIYPARGLLDDLGYQANTIFGHNHRLSYFSKRGINRTVQGVGGGCLCQLDPHYVRVTKLRSRWQLGTVIADIDVGQERASSFYNLEFHPDGDGLVTRLGFTSITSQ